MTENQLVIAEKEQVSQSYWSLVWWRFRKSRTAILGATIIIIFYTSFVIVPEFVAPNLLEQRSDFLESRPQKIHIRDTEGSWRLPFVYALEEKIDLELRLRYYEPDTSKLYPINFFVKGESYKLLGLIEWDVHLFGPDPEDPEATVFIMGTDPLGRDYFSRIIYGGRLSLMIGLIGVILTLVFGSVLGAISGYYGGVTDIVVQRGTEFLAAFPGIPLFMALSAAIPVHWSPIAVYFMITVILSFVSWGGLARQVRGLVLSLREREYVLAAISFGAGDRRILFRHLIPGALSHIIVISTLAIPGMILSETALSWLGLGLRPPLTSWGVLLNDAATVRAIRFAPWLLWTVPFIVITVLAYNMLGDGLRDATDPYSGR